MTVAGVSMIIMFISWLLLTAAFVFMHRQRKREKKWAKEWNKRKEAIEAGKPIADMSAARLCNPDPRVKKFTDFVIRVAAASLFLGFMIVMPNEGPQRGGLRFMGAVSHFAIGRFIIKTLNTLLITGFAVLAAFLCAAIVSWLLYGIIALIRKLQ